MTRREGRRRMASSVGAAALWASVAGLGTAAEARAAEPDRLLCGVSNVEDLVALPGSRWILGSGMGDSFFQGGGLHLIDAEAMTARRLELDFSEDHTARAPYDECPGPARPEAFSAHGLGLRANSDGSHNLYVVNHGGREAIEVFRVTPTEAEPQLRWIGCIPAPESSMPNAVAGRADGTVVMSATQAGPGTPPPVHELAGRPPDSDAADASADFGGAGPAAVPTGAVFEWTRASGWREVPGGRLPLNNGIELSPDEKWAYVNSWPEASVTRLPLDPAAGAVRKAKLDFFPDNIRWTHDGKLATTGQVATLEEVGGCVMRNDPHCAIDYRAARVDPETLEVTVLFDGTGTREFGLATTTLQTQDALWIGSARSDCVAVVSPPHRTTPQPQP